MAPRAQFATQLGVIAATVGSAVGLGNVWRFPYEAGVHGGGAFIVVYLFFIFVIGIPVICAEFIIGRSAKANVYGAFKKIPGTRLWNLIGINGILAAIMILSFYSVVAGWTADYIIRSIQGFNGASTQAQLHEQFDEFASSWSAVGWTLAFLGINFLILRKGVQKGIERMSNFMMPALFALLLLFALNSLLLPGAKEGLEFLLKPDFSKISPSVCLGAMGQAFFSLSIGLGCLITYASYIKPQTPLMRTAVTIAGLDTLVALLAGIIIFPAVFSFGETPAAGPKLVFEILPTVFQTMPLGHLWSPLFFVLLLLASLTSTISMAEIPIAYFCEEKKMKRSTATALTIGICAVLGSICSLRSELFNAFDFLSSTICLPIGGIFISLYVGYKLKRQMINAELSSCSRTAVNLLLICLRFIAPLCITLIFLSGLGLF